MCHSKNLFFCFFILLTLFSCDKFSFPESIFKVSQRDKYTRQYKGPDSLMNVWKQSYASALESKLQIPDGFTVTVTNKNFSAKALGYLLPLQQGDLLIIETGTDSQNPKVFVDVKPSSAESGSAESEMMKKGCYTKLIERSGMHKVVIQPEIDFIHPYTLKIYTQPSFGFPVAGADNTSAQSFWGAERDRGARQHEGVDIFAARGTPVIAASDGIILRTGDQGLGGKQVWQRDALSGYSLYYAHLDSIIAKSGRQLSKGDTLGTVGNTGNAKGGAPHLHFGIYSYEGAVNPWPFLRKRKLPVNLTTTFTDVKIVKAGSNVRLGPDSGYEVLTKVEKNSPVNFIAAGKDWLHIKLEDGREGFVARSRVSK